MKILIAVVIVVISVNTLSCKQEHYVTDNQREIKQSVEKNREESERNLVANYQKLSPQVKFIRNIDNPESGYLAQQAFISSSGLPLEPQFYSWVASNSQKTAVDLYKQFITDHSSHEYIMVFKQYEGWLLLTHFNMLSNSDGGPASDIEFILKQLIDSKYQGMALMYYTLDYLKRNKMIDASSIKKYAAEIIKIPVSTNITGDIQSDLKNSGKSVDPRVIQMINQHLQQENESAAFKEKIRALIE